MATSPPKPNMYDLSGDGIHITYTLEPIAGKPQLSYHDAARSLLFKGDDIRTVDTELGTLVTVTIVLKVDAGSTTFTVLIPTVNLGHSSSAPMETIGITTIHKFLIIGPPLQGQTELYKAHPLRGTASIVRS